MFEIIINKTGKSLVDRLDAVSYNIGYYDILSLNLPSWATSFIQSQADLSIYADLLYMQSKQYYLLSAEDTEEFKDLLRSRMLFTKDYLVENCHKSVKFALNSLLRPRTILKFFVFSNKLQVSKTEILHFLSFFSHYSYLIEKLKIKIISDNRNFITVHQFSDMIASIDDDYIQSLNIDGFISIMGELFDFFGEDGFIPAEAAIMFFDDKKLNHIATSIFSDFLTQNKAKLNREDLRELLKRLFVRADVIEFDENELTANSESFSSAIEENSIASIESEMFSSESETDEIAIENNEIDTDIELYIEDYNSSESEIETANEIDLSEFDLSEDKISHTGIEADNTDETVNQDIDLSNFLTDETEVTSVILENDELEIANLEDISSATLSVEELTVETISETEPEIDYSELLNESDTQEIADLVSDTNPDEQFSLLQSHVRAEQDIISALSNLLPSSDLEDNEAYAPEGAIDTISMPSISDNADLETALNKFINDFNEINKELPSNSENNSEEDEIINTDDYLAEFSDAILSDDTSETDSNITNDNISEIIETNDSTDEVEILSNDISIENLTENSSDESTEDSIANILDDIDLSEFECEIQESDINNPVPQSTTPEQDSINPDIHELKEAITKETSIEEQIIDIGDVILAAKDSFNNNEIGENFTDMDEDIFLLELKQHYNEESDEIC